MICGIIFEWLNQEPKSIHFVLILLIFFLFMSAVLFFIVKMTKLNIEREIRLKELEIEEKQIKIE